ncbi:hypothetical protein GCM10010435_64130 [Winogradskya consettensis]|uniref:Uncharacterized protein n=1 Tax=Winogradskya consettensis TaxID=113560 RepID=A0A919SGL2_9ACTN|nr:hypothetical protein Aco04nite_29830 [Actinoplanes consettensis]
MSHPAQQPGPLSHLPTNPLSDPALRHSGTPALRHSGTPALRHSGTPALRHSGTPMIKRSRGLITRSLRHPYKVPMLRTPRMLAARMTQGAHNYWRPPQASHDRGHGPTAEAEA